MKTDLSAEVLKSIALSSVIIKRYCTKWWFQNEDTWEQSKTSIIHIKSEHQTATWTVMWTLLRLELNPKGRLWFIFLTDLTLTTAFLNTNLDKLTTFKVGRDIYWTGLMSRNRWFCIIMIKLANCLGKNHHNNCLNSAGTSAN